MVLSTRESTAGTGQLETARPSVPKSRYTGSAALADRNSPLGSAQRSSAALETRTGRGAIRAISSCWSMGNWSSRSLNFLKLPQNQWGNDVLSRATVSPKLRRESAAPPAPELFEITIANRGSQAPAQRAVLPRRE